MRAAPGISEAFAHLASRDSKASQNRWIIIALDRPAGLCGIIFLGQTGTPVCVLHKGRGPFIILSRRKNHDRYSYSNGNQAAPLVADVDLFVIAAVLLWAPIKTRVNTYMLLVQLLGLYWVIQGIFNIVAMFMDHSGWGWKLFIGIVSIIAGGYILMYPIATGLVLPQIFVLMLGIWGLMEGIVLLIMAFRGGGWAAGILGVLAIVFGGILIANYSVPGMGLTMIWVAAIWGLFGGIVMVIQAFRLRKA
jgi:uncharacterized membrane protein HdeD (DUF308 family)